MRRILASVLLIFNGICMSSQTLDLSFGLPEGSALFPLVEKWISEVGEISGVDFNVHYIPFARAEKELLNGTIDGDIARTIYVYENDDRVIYTGYPILLTDLIIYTLNKNIDPTDITQLRRMKLILNRGSQAVLEWVKSNNIINVIYSNSSNSSFYMLLYERADYYIGTANYIKIIEDNPEFSSIIYLYPPVFQIPLYIVLNSKYKYLEPVISAAIKEMNDSGRTTAIFGENH